MRCLVFALACLSVLGSAHADTALQRALSINSVSDLAAVCRRGADHADRESDRNETYRLLSCISYIRGAHALYASYQRAFGTRTFCLPAGMTLDDQIDAFLAWADINQNRQGENAGQGFIVSLVHGFPCADETIDRTAAEHLR